MRRQSLVGVIAVCIVLFGIAAYFVGSRSGREQLPRAAAYVNPSQCAACHSKIAATYSRTGMARSFYRLTAQNTVEDFTRNNVFYHKASDSYFTMERRGDKYYQRRHQIGYDGKPANIVEKQIDYVMGSGNHVRTYISRDNRGRLIQLPLAWYSEQGGRWAMNPGFDRADHRGFRRAVSYECMSCHNAYPDPASSDTGFGSKAVFSSHVPEGIDCQRCHGPGSAHVQAAQTPGAELDTIRAAIVNPSRLTAERQLEVCMQCHLETTSYPLPNSLPRFDRGWFAYRPGQPLGETMLFFDHAPGKGRDDKFEIVSAAYRLRQSVCFKQSAGKLLCTTCHNAHDTPPRESAARQFVAVCRQCHSATLDRLLATGVHPRSEDCLGCHMPKRRTEDVVHAVITDHLIQRRKPASDLTAPRAERNETAATAYRGEVVPYYPATPPSTAENELYVAVAQVVSQSNLIDGVARLSVAIEKHHPKNAEFYLHFAEALRNTGKFDEALSTYEEALRRQPKSVVALLLFGEALRLAHQTDRGASILKQALDLEPDNESAWYELGMVYLDQGKRTDAIAAFEKAVQFESDMPEAYNSLGASWLQDGEAAKAEPALRAAIRSQPDNAAAHNNLGDLLSSAGDLRQACFEYEAALRHQPTYGAARYNYGLALARLRRFGEAEQQIEAALRINPKSAGAHQVLAALLGARGKRELAISHFREALTLDPEFGLAHLGLADLLANSGDFAGALSHARQAAGSPEASVRAQAQAMLQRLEGRHDRD